VAEDGAICCFVPVNLGQELSVVTHFIGKTTYIAQDVLIDGVLRNFKTAISNGKHNLNEKASFNTFLFLQPK
jgi:hypothetical protein